MHLTHFLSVTHLMRCFGQSNGAAPTIDAITKNKRRIQDETTSIHNSVSAALLNSLPICKVSVYIDVMLLLGW